MVWWARDHWFQTFCRIVEYWLFYLGFLGGFFMVVWSATVRYNVYICIKSFTYRYWSILRKKLYLISWVSDLETDNMAGKSSLFRESNMSVSGWGKKIGFTETDTLSHGFRWVWKLFFLQYKHQLLGAFLLFAYITCYSSLTCYFQQAPLPTVVS